MERRILIGSRTVQIMQYGLVMYIFYSVSNAIAAKWLLNCFRGVRG